MKKPVFVPRREGSVGEFRIEEFREQFEKKLGREMGTLRDYDQFHWASVEHKNIFWNHIIQYFKVIYEGDGELTFDKGGESFIPYAWYPKMRLNFAENLLKGEGPDDHELPALSFRHENLLHGQEGGPEHSYAKRDMTRGQLSVACARLAHFLKEQAAFSRDEVLAAYMPNAPETVISMLATSALGAIFTSTSSDFGVAGVLDRFSQTAPRVLVAATHYTYKGKVFDQREKIRAITKKLPALKTLILVDLMEEGVTPDTEADYGVPTYLMKDILEADSASGSTVPPPPLNFVRRPFKAPLYIMYSSGTTGKPKCIVHSQGGTLLQHLKELGLHTNLKASEKILYFTTCGWMMWNWLASALALKAHVYLYEGLPADAEGDPGAFVELISAEGIHVWGTSPKFLKALELSGYQNKDPLPALRALLSTGAPLLPEQFDFIYQKLKAEVLVSSICGGTDIIGCFMLGHPALPVWRGEIQCLSLGMEVAAASASRAPAFEAEVLGTPGELVCLSPFPSCPVGFWGDDHQNTRFKKSYFEKMQRGGRPLSVWHHGDYISLASHQVDQSDSVGASGSNGTQLGVVVHGRSDATLNPGGIRIGTAEIYRPLEQFPEIEDSVAAGLERKGDVEIVLFVKMSGTVPLPAVDFEERIRPAIVSAIRTGAGPRHVPTHIFQVQAIPYTRSGKKMEMLVNKIINGRPVDNLEALAAAPDILDDYKIEVDS